MAKTTKTTSHLQFKRRIGAPPKEVFRALTRASLLRDWFCHSAQSDARKGGRVYFGWSNGYAALGEYTALEADKKSAFTWLGTKDPGPSRVTITLSSNGGATDVRVRQTLPGRGAAAQRAGRSLTRLWESGLENLQSLLETGEDLRITRRPMLGINVGDFDADVAAKMGVPAKEGVKLDGVVAEMGAAAAGLKKDDVLVSIGGRRVAGWSSLAPILQRFRAGDKVGVEFFRGPAKRTTTMTLSGRRLPPIPAEPRALAAELRRIHQGLMGELREGLQGVSEDHAGRRPAAGEWSAKHVLAHLIAGERDNHGWMAEVLEADDPVESPGNVGVRMDAIVDTFGTTAALLEELERDFAITARMVEALPRESAARKADYWKIGHNLLQPEDHVRGHLEQIRQAVSAAAAG
ncbi:MAG TPA: SRPBCC domain-containing protein [Anaerolineales bacterium]